MNRLTMCLEKMSKKDSGTQQQNNNELILAEVKKVSTSLKAEMEIFEKSVISIMRDNSFSVMESILFHCEKNEIEIELVAKLITPNLKIKLKKEAVGLHFIKTRRNRKKREKVEKT